MRIVSVLEETTNALVDIVALVRVTALELQSVLLTESTQGLEQLLGEVRVLEQQEGRQFSIVLEDQLDHVRGVQGHEVSQRALGDP